MWSFSILVIVIVSFLYLLEIPMWNFEREKLLFTSSYSRFLNAFELTIFFKLTSLYELPINMGFYITRAE